jgi:hypothetical protein
VQPFGEWLGIPRHHIRAVDVRYNSLSGQWWDYEQDRWGERPDVQDLDPKATPLIQSQGKADVVRELLGERVGRSMLVGDGMSDIAAQPVVDLVVGFGGVITRERVITVAKIFIKANSLAPLMPIALSSQEQATLPGTAHAPILAKGTALIEAGEVYFQP